MKADDVPDLAALRAERDPAPGTFRRLARSRRFDEPPPEAEETGQEVPSCAEQP